MIVSAVSPLDVLALGSSRYDMVMYGKYGICMYVWTGYCRRFALKRSTLAPPP